MVNLQSWRLLLPTEQEVFGVITLAFTVLILLAAVKPSMFKFLRDKGTDFPSLQRQGQYIVMLTMTWGFMWQVAKDKLSTEYATFYALIFVGSQAVSIWNKTRGQKTPVDQPAEVKPAGA